MISAQKHPSAAPPKLPRGVPGNERFKGSHSMRFYHSSELCYLAQTYLNLLITKQPLDLYFARTLPKSFRGESLWK